MGGCKSKLLPTGFNEACFALCTVAESMALDCLGTYLGGIIARLKPRGFVFMPNLGSPDG